MVKNRLFYIPAFAIPIIGLIIGTFFDWDVSSGIAAVDNVFGKTVACIGELSLYGGLAFIGGLLIKGCLNSVNKKVFVVLGIILGIIAIILGSFLQGSSFTSINAWNILPHETYGLLHYLVSILIGSLLVVPFGILGLFIGKNISKPSEIIIILIICAFLVFSLILVNFIIKLIFCRPRFRMLVNQPFIEQIGYSTGKELYVDWFVRFKEYDSIKNTLSKLENPLMSLSDFNENCKSFPSGHTSSATMALLILPMASYFLTKNRKNDWIFFLIGIAWALFVGFSRIFAGAHFLSDVSFGMLISVILSFICNEILQRTYLKNEENSYAR